MQTFSPRVISTTPPAGLISILRCVGRTVLSLLIFEVVWVSYVTRHHFQRCTSDLWNFTIGRDFNAWRYGCVEEVRIVYIRSSSFDLREFHVEFPFRPLWIQLTKG